MKIPTRGTCPTCKRQYALKHNGALRRHSSDFDECFTTDQWPVEIIKVVVIISKMGEDDDKNTPESESPDSE